MFIYLASLWGLEMGKESVSTLFGNLGSLMRKLLFVSLSVGPIPNHIALIMDGNRRFAKKRNLKEGTGHKAGFLTLMSLLKYCYELGVKYVTVYAFSIENFKRKPEEVQYVMDLMQEKIEGLLREETIVNEYGVRIYFVGNLKLLHESVRVAAEKAMLATANNTKTVLLICVAYTSTDEIVHAVQESCEHNKDGVMSEDDIKVVDLEKHMYMAVAPDPDILIRSSGETRLSNFLLWQTTNCQLFCPRALWPEIGLWHLVWAVLNFQRNYSYLEKKKKQQ
uniref:Alkyl transferase n=1 Tax=Davidia involucrata TaxID=16924 RepID=A0A5B7C2R5_DAVIN